jgi:hypothetical protein
VNPFAIGFLLINMVMLLLLPRRYAAGPFLIGVCYMTLGQRAELGPFTFNVVRLLVLAGITRTIIRGEHPAGETNRLDWLMLIWSVWALISSNFHEQPRQELIFDLSVSIFFFALFIIPQRTCL